jgi:DNA-binding MarR family transcriptional regulator
MWDVLLDLYASEAEGKRITISSACIAAAVPPTTALRVIKALEEAGSIERYRFGQDARRVHVRLTATARIRLAAYLQMYGVVVPR